MYGSMYVCVYPSSQRIFLRRVVSSRKTFSRTLLADTLQYHHHVPEITLSHTYIHTYIHTYKHTNIHTYSQSVIFYCKFTHTQADTYIQTNKHYIKRTYCEFIHSYKQTYSIACIHTYIHTYIHTGILLYGPDGILTEVAGAIRQLFTINEIAYVRANKILIFNKYHFSMYLVYTCK